MTTLILIAVVLVDIVLLLTELWHMQQEQNDELESPLWRSKEK